MPLPGEGGGPWAERRRGGLDGGWGSLGALEARWSRDSNVFDVQSDDGGRRSGGGTVGVHAVCVETGRPESHRRAADKSVAQQHVRPGASDAIGSGRRGGPGGVGTGWEEAGERAQSAAVLTCDPLRHPAQSLSRQSPSRPPLSSTSAAVSRRAALRHPRTPRPRAPSSSD